MKPSHRVFGPLLAGSLLATLLFAAMPACAGNTARQTLTRSLPVAAGTSVSVENLAGRMEVSQGGAQLEVTATIVAGGKDQAAADALAKTIKLSVATSGGRVSVHVDYPVDQYDRYRYDRASGEHGDDHDDCLFGF
ncbi:MAG: hypothetical protein ACRESC_08250, partial [Gammaproteobacteria bacterium]